MYITRKPESGYLNLSYITLDRVSTREYARTQKVLCKNELKITFLLNNFGCFCYKVVSKCNLNKSWWIVVCYLNWFERIFGKQSEF